MVEYKPYVPARGEVIWLQFNPQAGHEQAGRRPVFVVSPQSYNEKVGLGLFCPITSRAKGYPFEVRLPNGLPLSGVILSDQVKSLDWQARRAEYCCTATPEVIAEVSEKLRLLI